MMYIKKYLDRDVDSTSMLICSIRMSKKAKGKQIKTVRVEPLTFLSLRLRDAPRRGPSGGSGHPKVNTVNSPSSCTNHSWGHILKPRPRGWVSTGAAILAHRPREGKCQNDMPQLQDRNAGNLERPAPPKEFPRNRAYNAFTVASPLRSRTDRRAGPVIR